MEEIEENCDGEGNPSLAKTKQGLKSKRKSEGL